MRAEAHISRVGVQEYLDENGKTRKELRLPEEVFSPKSLESFAQVPVTRTHPSEKVDARNARMYMVGASGDVVKRDDDHVLTTLMIADADTLDEMRANDKYDVSCGYTCDVIDEAGVHPVYGEYHAIQRNIRGNHIAVAINHGRAGTARARVDAANARHVLEEQISTSRQAARALVGRRDVRRPSTTLRLDSAAVSTSRVDANLTTSVDGHQHLIELQPDYGDRMSGTTSWAVAAGADTEHGHAWIRNADGTIEIAESAGHTHAIETDSGLDSVPGPRQDDVGQAPRAPSTPNRGRTMPPTPKKNELKADDKDKLLQSAAEELSKAELRADAAEAELDAAVKRGDTAEGRVASLEAEIKSLKTNRLDETELKKRDLQIEALSKKIATMTTRLDVATDPKTLGSKVRRRVKIIKAAEAIMGDKYISDSMEIDDRELMAAVVEKLQNVDIRKDDDGAERSVEYVTARFDAAVDSFTNGVDALDRLRDVARTRHVEEPREDTATSARAKYVQRQQTAWQPKKTA